MKPLPRNSTRNFAGYGNDSAGIEPIPQFIPQFCGIAEPSRIPGEIRGSRHFPRQNGESSWQKSRIGGNPAVFLEILRDRRPSENLSPETREKRTQIRTWCPDFTNAETYRPIGEIVEELRVIEAEAAETDKALKELLEKIGV